MEKEHSSQFRRRMPKRPKIPKVDQCGNTGNIDMGRRVERAKPQSRGWNPQVGAETLEAICLLCRGRAIWDGNLAARVHSVNQGRNANHRNTVRRLRVHMEGVRLEYLDDRIMLLLKDPLLNGALWVS